MDDKKLLEQFDELLQRRLKSFATKDDLKDLATKDDVSASETRLSKIIKREVEDLADLIGEGFKGLDAKADKAETLSLRVRVDKLEEKVFHN